MKNYKKKVEINKAGIDFATAKESQTSMKIIPINELNKITFENNHYPEIKREGVFEHIFKCVHCGLHFKVYSWQEFRHTSNNTYCPECGKRGSYHRVNVISTDEEFDLFGGNEIFDHCCF